MTARRPDDLAQAVFGSVDGVVSCAGLILGGIITGARASVLLGTVAALAAASAVSMAGGEYLADENTDGRSRRRAAIMGVAMLVASAVPGAGYLAGSVAGQVFAAVSIIAMTLGIAGVRARRHGWARALTQTFVVLAVASVAAVLATLAVGASG